MNTVGTSTSVLTARLREETREAHERVEAALGPLIEKPSLAHYAVVLSRWRAFLEYWEPAVERVAADSAIAAELRSRSKIHWIDQDLWAIDSSGDRVAFDQALLPVPDWPTALGGIYVIEGSTLGGQVLCKRIGEALSLSPQSGLRYFNSYGPQTAERWRQTKELLNDPRWNDAQNRIIDGARNTFAALTEFFCATLPFRTI